MEVAHFTTRWGAGYTMAKTERGPMCLRFEGDEGFILDQLDGTRTVRQIVVDRLNAADDFDPAAVVDVVEILEQTGFLEQPWVDTDELIRGATRSRVVRWNDRMRAALKSQTVRVRQVDVWADWLYRHGARYVFTRGGQVVLLVLLFGGLALFVDEVHSGRFRLSGEALVTSAGLLLVLDFLATMVHEAGHALAIRHARRRILSGGFQLYLGHPAFFIDSADILMSPPRDRIRQAWFGPYASLVVAGTVAALAWFFPHLPIAHVLFNLAVLTYFTALMNLIPFLELDGYWILMDALQTTDLRPRSLSFLRREAATQRCGTGSPSPGSSVCWSRSECSARSSPSSRSARPCCSGAPSSVASRRRCGTPVCGRESPSSRSRSSCSVHWCTGWVRLRRASSVGSGS